MSNGQDEIKDKPCADVGEGHAEGEGKLTEAVRRVRRASRAKGGRVRALG